jgi:hypothetical protein
MTAFISYSHHDRALAQRISKTLSRFNLQYWWDDRIELSAPWSPVLKERLTAASSVLVLWTPPAAASEWVLYEAAFAHKHEKLVQMRVGETTLPAAFAALQAADLSVWPENTLPRGIRRVLNKIADLQGLSAVVDEHTRAQNLVLSSARVARFIDEKKHHEGYFPKLDGPLYKDIWEMQMNGCVKLYDELYPGSRTGLDEERYYELLEFLSDDGPSE